MAKKTPLFLIRAAVPRDHRELLALARELDSINLPTDSGELRDAIERSALSFAGRMRRRERAIYLFVAERVGRGSLAGASLIIGKHGTPESPHYYLDIDSDERYSKTLRRMFRHTYLRLRHSMDGPTEIGGLIVAPRMRRHPERVGKQLSWVRFLYLARHRERFERRVIAEMLPTIGPGHENLFWDHYGRAVTGLSFREADRLSTQDKEFIRALFPDSPLYTFLLPKDVRNSLGVVGDDTRGAVRLLEMAGMRFLEQIDPFDAGPYYGGEVEDLIPVKQFVRARAVAGTPDPERAGRWLVARDSVAGFRAVAVPAVREGARLVVPHRGLELLRLEAGGRVCAVPLP
jgi:arginine N-succinyltransferase